VRKVRFGGRRGTERPVVFRNLFEKTENRDSGIICKIK
jgi:hypothetical protein